MYYEGIIATSIIFFVLALIIGLVCGFVSAKIAQGKGYSYGAFFALGFFLGIIGLIISLVLQDKHASKIDVADGLLKYKQLLDEGVINSDEFEQKKSALLNENQDVQKKETNPKVIFGIGVVALIVSILFLTQIIPMTIALFSNLSGFGYDLLLYTCLSFAISSIVTAITGLFLVLIGLGKGESLRIATLILGIAGMCLVVIGFIMFMLFGAFIEWLTPYLVIQLFISLFALASSLVAYMAKK